jgi:hypothetical protein
MKDWVKVALDCGLLNYVDHDNQNYFIDGYADVNTVRQFVHDLTAELVAENGRLDSYNKELLYDNDQKFAEIQRLLRMVGK